MVRGLDRFRSHFASAGDCFVLIGGVASERWFLDAGLEFRVTKDFDMVLLVEALDDGFLDLFWTFVREGRYLIKECSTGKRNLFRFLKPTDESFPAMLELFSRAPDRLSIPPDQTVVPIRSEDTASGLSAILMDDDYYNLVSVNRESMDGVSVVTPPCLIILKMRAWLDLTRRRDEGISVDSREINKHRNDVFKLAVLLEPGRRLIVPPAIREHIGLFLGHFPAESPEWQAIRDASALKRDMPDAKVLLDLLRGYFVFHS